MKTKKEIQVVLKDTPFDVYYDIRRYKVREGIKTVLKIMKFDADNLETDIEPADIEEVIKALAPVANFTFSSIDDGCCSAGCKCASAIAIFTLIE